MKLLAVLMMMLSSLSQAATSPEQLWVEYHAALKKDGMVATTKYVHPEELARFKRMVMPVFRREATSQKREWSDAFFGKGIKLAEIEAMSGADLMTAMLEAFGDKIEMKFSDPQMIGTVRENDLVHIVTRVTVHMGNGAVKAKSVDVVTAKAYGKDWMLVLSPELEGFSAALGSQ